MSGDLPDRVARLEREIRRHRLLGFVAVLAIGVALVAGRAARRGLVIAPETPVQENGMFLYALGCIEAIVVSLSAIIVAGVAVPGLWQWRRQLRGRTEYELARRFLRSAYRVRDAMALVRNPLGFQDPDKERANYEERWANLVENLSELRMERAEAEVHWRESVRDALKPLYRCIGELRVSLSDYLEQTTRPDPPEMSPERRRGIEGVVFEISEDPGQDPFTAKIADAINRVEALVEPHLRM